jgi:putative transposase
MSRFKKLSQTLWHCQYHIVWVPKYRYRILSGKIAKQVEECIRAFSQQQGGEIIELNVQVDHVHLLAMVPPKVSISGYVGTIKGRTAIRILNQYRELKQKPYWGNHFWSRGYCVDTVGLDTEMVRKYVKYQEAKERASEKPQY